MKCKVSIPERLKDLRTERHLTLEELEAAVQISKSALGSYEADDDSSKEISHKNILKLADFYQVSTDYLLCLTDNRNPENTEFTELHINDEMAELLKSGRINNRLLCEIATHEKFCKLLADAEIYVDGVATMRLRDLNMSLEDARALVTGEDASAAVNRALDTLEAGIIDEEEFFCHLTHKHWDAILHDIRKIHEKDSGSVPDIMPAQEIILKVRKALMSPGDSIGKLTQIFCDCLTAKPGEAVNGGAYAPFILTVDWLGWFCYLPVALSTIFKRITSFHPEIGRYVPAICIQ